jgi:uncharacterized protein (TIRG00374 family)
VLVVLAANVGRFLLLGARWEILVRKEAPLGFRSIVEILMAGNFLQLIAPVFVPVAGPVLRAYYLSKETGKPRARFYGTIVADQTANFSIFAVGMIVSGVMTAAEGTVGVSAGTGAALLLALVGGLYVGKRHLERFRDGEPSLLRRLMRSVVASRLFSRWDRAHRLVDRFIEWWDHLLEALSHSLLGSGTWWPAIGVSTALFLLLALAQHMACAAVGSPITFARAAFAVSGAAFVQILALAPGRVGVTEASLVGIFLALGLDPASATAATFLARMMNYAVLIPWGGLCFFRLQREYGPAREEAPNGTAA